MSTSKKISQKREHKWNSYPMWIAIIGLLVSLTTLSIIIARALLKGIPANTDPYMIYQGWLGLLWFDNLQTFTILGNLLVLVFWLVYLLWYKTSVFKDNRFILYTCSYIAMVGFMYWAILIPVQGTDPAKLPELSYLTHLVTPVIFIAFTISTVFYNKKHFLNTKTKKTYHVAYWKFLGLGVIFPVCYVAYLIGINFVPIPDYVFNTTMFDGFQNELMSSIAGSGGHNYISVYGSITNFNPHCLAKIANGPATTYEANSGGSWINLAYVFGIILLIPAVQALLVLLNNKVNH